jgi:UDP-N-acetylmuramoylalanine--D-glutamate ligase
VNYKEFFNNKKISVVGVGPHGEMVADIKFLLKNKAKVSLFEMRSEKRMKDYLIELKDFGLDKYVFGKVNGDDLLESDLIILSPEISKKSLFLKKAISAEINIEFPETLFFKLSPPITLIGVLGMYGKTMVAGMIHTILKKSFSEYKDQGLFFIDPESTNGALSYLKKIKKDDVVLARIPEYQIPHYHEIHISPHVAVITSATSFNLLAFQTYNNFIVAPDDVVDAIKLEKDFALKAKILRTRPSLIPTDWNLSVLAGHDRENIALVIQTCELFKVPTEMMREIIQNYSGIKGSVEFIKKVGGIEFYNDANSILPKSTLSALQSISQNKNIVLIMGGAYTGHDYTELIKNIPQYVSTVILLPGSGTLGIRVILDELSDIKILQSLSLEDAVKVSLEQSKKGDRVVFSPAFEAVGVDISRKERGERFVRAVRAL